MAQIDVAAAVDAAQEIVDYGSMALLQMYRMMNPSSWSRWFGAGYVTGQSVCLILLAPFHAHYRNVILLTMLEIISRPDLFALKMI